MENIDSVVDITSIELPQYITTLEELVNTRGAIVQQETVDKGSLLSVFQPNPETLKARLIVWASLGFTPSWIIFTQQVNPPPVCSDGQIRGFYDYVRYLIGSDIAPFLTKLDSQVPGVTFNFILRDINTIGLNVIKASLHNTNELPAEGI